MTTAADPPVATPTSIWRPLARPLFRAVWVASVASHVGSYMTDVGQGWLMTSLSPSPLVVSLLLTAESVPFFLLGLPAGALADIIDRRRLLLVTQIAMAVVVGTLAVATLAGVVTPTMMLALAFALGVATALNDPAWHSVIPELLPGDELAAGVTLNAVGINVARTLGPALGGLVVAFAGPGAVFVLDALSFLGVVATLLSWRRERTRSALPAERMLGAIRGGLRFARYSDALRRVLAGIFLFMICGAGVMALMPVLGRETGHGAVGFGLLLGSLGVGAVSGAAWLPRVRAKLSTRGLVVAAFLAFAAVAAGVAVVRDLVLLCPILFVGGVAWIAVLSTLTVAAQQASPSWVRARALAVFLMVFQAAVAGGSLLWGAVATHAGLGAAYFGIAGGLVVGAAAVARLRPGSNAVEDHTPAGHWADPVVAGDPSLDAGPIMVTVEFVVDAEKVDEFTAAIAELGLHRRRSGVIEWWVFQDTADPTRFVESWIDASWADHLRYHERVSVAHRDVELHVQSLTRRGTAYVTRHFIAPGAHPSSRAAVDAVLERTAGCRGCGGAATRNPELHLDEL
jgi:MFS family permease